MKTEHTGAKDSSHDKWERRGILKHASNIERRRADRFIADENIGEMEDLQGQCVYVLAQHYHDSGDTMPRVFAHESAAFDAGNKDVQVFKDQEPYAAPEPVEKYALRWSWRPTRYEIVDGERHAYKWMFDPGWTDSGFHFEIERVEIE